MPALQSMYADLVCQVRVGGCVGAAFESLIGVKQVCPLSPTLFGTFIDGLYFMTESKAADAGPQLSSGRRVPSMLYADNFVSLLWAALRSAICIACLAG